MSDFAMMPGAQEDPEENSLAVELASFTVTFAVGRAGMLGELTQDDLDEFRESYVKPAFTRAKMEIEKKLGDVLDVRNIKTKKGSIIVEAVLFALIEVANHPVVSGAAGGLLTAIITKKVSSAGQGRKYKELMQKISEIIKSHTENLRGGDFSVTKASIPIYNPKLKAYRAESFEFHSKDIEKIQEDVETAINNYHHNIGKP